MTKAGCLRNFCNHVIFSTPRRLFMKSYLNTFLGSSTKRAASWTTIGFVVSYAVRLSSTLILTRLLAPEAFGLMSLAAVFITGLAMLSDIGTKPSVIRSERGDDADFLHTAWTIQAVRGVVISGLLLVLSWPISWAYGEPLLFPILCVVAINPFLNGLATISTSTCRRHMQIKPLVLLRTGSHIVTTFLNIAFAWWLGSVWALVVGGVLGSALSVIAGYIWLPAYRPKAMFEPAAMKEIVHFGRWILLGTLFTYMGGQGSRAVMGFEVSIETLGLITIATTLAWAIGDLVRKLLGEVAFPKMSKVHREGGSLSATVDQIKTLMFFGVLPAFILVSVFAQHIVDFLYDPRYAPSGRFLALFALNGAVSVLSMPYQNALLVMGDSRAHSIVMGVFAALRVGLMILGAQFFGILGLVVGLGLASGLTLVVSHYFIRKHNISSLGYDIITIVIIAALYIYNLS
jgi:O-antigen/teichoic acid export membrane protein